MILIFGGAYQGKLEYAIKQFGINEDDIFSCTDEKIDFSKTVITDLEKFTLACVEAELDPIKELKSHRNELEDKILIASDVSQGIVPMDKTQRAWREINGRALIYLAGESEQVIRVFCGIGQKIK